MGQLQVADLAAVLVPARRRPQVHGLEPIPQPPLPQENHSFSYIYEMPGADQLKSQGQHIHLETSPRAPLSCGTQERGSASARGEDVELVALRVGQTRPRDVAL